MAQQVLPVSESRRRIGTWLAAHAPSGLARLNPPASPGDIRDAERVLDIPLPGDLGESLRCHNGQGAQASLLPGHAEPLPASGIAECWQMRMDIAAGVDGLP
jgi:cell wall assembly regulator SMI1